MNVSVTVNVRENGLAVLFRRKEDNVWKTVKTVLFFEENNDIKVYN